VHRNPSDKTQKTQSAKPKPKQQNPENSIGKTQAQAENQQKTQPPPRRQAQATESPPRRASTENPKRTIQHREKKGKEKKREKKSDENERKEKKTDDIYSGVKSFFNQIQNRYKVYSSFSQMKSYCTLCKKI
jgi:hypothetical protein